MRRSLVRSRSYDWKRDEPKWEKAKVIPRPKPPELSSIEMGAAQCLGSLKVQPRSRRLSPVPMTPFEGPRPSSPAKGHRGQHKLNPVNLPGMPMGVSSRAVWPPVFQRKDYAAPTDSTASQSELKPGSPKHESSRGAHQTDTSGNGVFGEGFKSPGPSRVGARKSVEVQLPRTPVDSMKEPSPDATATVADDRSSVYSNGPTEQLGGGAHGGPRDELNTGPVETARAAVKIKDTVAVRKHRDGTHSSGGLTTGRPLNQLTPTQRYRVARKPPRQSKTLGTGDYRPVPTLRVAIQAEADGAPRKQGHSKAPIRVALATRERAREYFNG